MQESDAIARLKGGDIGGLEALVQAYQVQALEAAYVITRNYAMSEDIVQSSFVRAYERIGQFDSSRHFGPWFLRSVVNSALTAVTSQRHISLDTQDDQATVGGGSYQTLELSGLEPGPEETLEAAETKEEIIAALEKLSPGQRAAVVLRYYLDFSDTEVSQRLEIPPGTVRRRLHDARQRLRRLLPNRVI